MSKSVRTIVTPAVAAHELARRTHPKGSALRTPPAKPAKDATPSPAYVAFGLPSDLLRELVGTTPAPAKAPAKARTPKAPKAQVPAKAPARKADPAKADAQAAFDLAFEVAPEGHKVAAGRAAYGATLKGGDLDAALAAAQARIAARLAK